MTQLELLRAAIARAKELVEDNAGLSDTQYAALRASALDEDGIIEAVARQILRDAAESE